MGRPAHLVCLLISRLLSTSLAVQGTIPNRSHAPLLEGFSVDPHFPKLIPDILWNSGANPTPGGGLSEPRASGAGVVGPILSRKRPRSRRRLMHLTCSPQPCFCGCRTVQQLWAEAQFRADPWIRLLSAQREPFFCFVFLAVVIDAHK